MKKTSFIIQLMLALGLAAMIGCQGGGGGGGAAAPSTKAVVTLSTTGTLASGTQIAGITVTVNLPAGVTAKATPVSAGTSSMTTDNGVITPAGAAATGSYSSGGYFADAATYKIVVGVGNASGFSTGEFAQVSCDIAEGSSPTAADFSVSDISVSTMSANGDVSAAVPLAASGLSLGFTVAIQ